MNLNYTYVSPSTKILRGYEPEEVMKVLPADTLTPSSWDLVVKTLSEVMELEKIKQVGLNESRTIPLEMKRKDGTTVWTEVKFSFIRDKDQQPVGILGVTRDITERKRVQEALKESEKKYRLLADNVDDVLFILDTNLNYTYISPSVKTLMGYEPEELLNLRSSETMTPSSWEMAVRTLSEIMEIEKSGHRENKKPQMFQLEMKRKDGSTVWTEIKTSFVRDKNQQPVGIIGVSRDITERKRAEAKLLETLNSLKKAVDTTIHVMVSVIEARDPYTAGHQFRVADLARAIATEMGLDQEKIDGIQLAGSIHDIGKLSVPAEILSKPTKLTKIEFSMIKEHPQSGYEILKDVESPWPLAQVAYQHHERMDGSGYPRNLKGDEILMEARIMAVADVVEAMSSHRPYRSALGIDAALEEIEKNRGTLYDDAVADACLRLFREKNYKLIT
jgi:PAS domain S-box-containing protein